jgi:ferrous iron transport protein B
MTVLERNAPAGVVAPVRVGALDPVLPVVALVGRPNVGKSTFLGRACGRFVETANAPGTTVGAERRRVNAHGRSAWLVDLPGTRGLTDEPTGDAAFWSLLAAEHPDALLVVTDAGDLERHLPLVLACRDLGLPVVMAANMTDEASRAGVSVDAGRLGQLLALPVHATTGRTGAGIDGAVADAVALAAQRIARRAGTVSPRATVPVSIYPPALESSLVTTAGVPQGIGAAGSDRSLATLVDAGVFSRRGIGCLALSDVLEPHRRAAARRFTAEVEHHDGSPDPLAVRLARAATTPWPGLPLLLISTLALFAGVVLLGGRLSTLLSDAWAAWVSPLMTSAVGTLLPVPVLGASALWALDSGLLAMLAVGIPYVLVFTLALAALEDSGYLTSAAILLDRVFSGLGLPGRAAIPLLTAAGCNVPAIYGTRVLRTRRERTLAAFLVTLTPCSARSAVIIAALVPFVGPAAAMAAFGLVLAIGLGAGIAANAVVPGRQSAMVMELAPLRVPLIRGVAAKGWSRFRAFLVTATPIMLVGSFCLGLLVESGLWAPLASALEPASRWLLGLPAIVTVAIALAILRKELALQLLIVFGVLGVGTAAASADHANMLTPGQLFVYAIVVAISIPCVATLAALRAELGGRTAAAISLASLGLAVAAGAILARLLGLA